MKVHQGHPSPAHEWHTRCAPCVYASDNDVAASAPRSTSPRRRRARRWVCWQRRSLSSSSPHRRYCQGLRQTRSGSAAPPNPGSAAAPPNPGQREVPAKPVRLRGMNPSCFRLGELRSSVASSIVCGPHVPSPSARFASALRPRRASRSSPAATPTCSGSVQELWREYPLDPQPTLAICLLPPEPAPRDTAKRPPRSQRPRTALPGRKGVTRCLLSSQS
jgi:hypothetical protein